MIGETIVLVNREVAAIAEVDTNNGAAFLFQSEPTPLLTALVTDEQAQFVTLQA